MGFFFFFSSKRSSGDSPGWNHALCHSAGLRMSSSCRQRHGEEGECQAVMLEIERINLAPWMISCWLCCRGFVHGKGPDCKRKENTAGWSDTSHRDVCSCFASVIGKGEWFRVLRVHYFIRFNIHEISLTAFPFVFVVLRWYWQGDQFATDTKVLWSWHLHNWAARKGLRVVCFKACFTAEVHCMCCWWNNVMFFQSAFRRTVATNLGSRG